MGNFISISISFDYFFSSFQKCIAKNAYQHNLKDDLKSLQTESEDLIQLKNDVLRKVIVAEQEQKQRLNRVQLWLTRVQDVEIEVGEVQEARPQEIEKLCLGGFCSKNCKSSYKLRKKVAKVLRQVRRLKHEGHDIKEVAMKVPEEQVEQRPSEPTIVGQQSTFDEVWRCLQEEQGRVIGLYGMGGVGKTTLLTEINNKFLETPNGYDIVIWAVVSKDMQLEGIQEKIAKRLGLFNELWKNKNRDEKASDIFKILSKKKFVLLLDDIWAPVELSKVGIPLPSPKVSSKIVFTTRFVEVCGHMEAQKKFRVACLNHQDAWRLFQQKVGEDTLESHPNIRNLAKTVTKKCGGLPLALITLGRAMTCKRAPEEWNYAVQVLRKSASEFPSMGKEVYPLLKFSYDSLLNDTIRSCFLYCSLFPEDYSISKRVLIDCWLGEGFLTVNDGSGVRNEGYYIIGELLHASLLEEVNDNCVRMHDVIRDMALWIASEIEKEKHNFLVHVGGQLIEVPEIEKWNGVRRMSLMNNQIEKLYVIPSCPCLQTLLVNGNDLKMITSDFFQFMPSLKVLNLSCNFSLVELPSGISKLVSLQYLDLSWTSIKELPEELKALASLKCLILENTPNLHVIPRYLISSFSKLCVLRMLNYDSPHQVPQDSVLCGDGGFLIEELFCLSYLNELSITLKCIRALQMLLSSLKLQSCTRFLCFKYFDDSKSLNILSLVDMMNLHSLVISHCKNLEKLEIDNARGVRVTYGFHSLQQVDINWCSKLRDLTWLVFAPNLKYIDISNCCDMEEIISAGKLGEHPEIMCSLNPLTKIEFLFLRSLQNLKSIYWNALPFPHLKSISVIGCPELKKLPLNSHSTKDHKVVIVGEEHWWQVLEWDDQAAQDAFLPCFKSGSRV